MKCHWWNRWWHRRLRRIDREVMLPALAQAASRRMPDRPAPERGYYIDKAWWQFIDAPGQEHWHCACAAADGGEP